MKYIDSHAHYLANRFNKDRNKKLIELLNSDLEYIIECGTNTRTNKDVLDLCKKYNNIYGVIGYYPLDVKELDNPLNFAVFKNQLTDKNVIGIGEIGLDYHYDTSYKDTQKEYFKLQLELAKTLNLPVCIHSRDAEKDTVNILKEFGENVGVIHCYAYGKETMETLCKLGYYFGVGGTCTYKNNIALREAIVSMPIERILLETDSPYLSPSEVRQNRNDSGNIKYVIKELSKLKGISEEDIIKKTNDNVRKVYNKII